MRPAVRILVGVAAVAVVLVGVVVAVTGLARGGDDDTTTRPTDGPAESASTGPMGTRELDRVPDDLPAGLVVEDATDLSATVAREGDDWSATIVFRTSRDLDELVASAEQTLLAEGYTQQRRTSRDAEIVTTYEGEDGSVLTTTARGDEPLNLFHAVRVSP